MLLEVGCWCGTPKVGEAAPLPLLFLSWWGQLFLLGKLLLGSEKLQLEGWEDAGNMKLSSFSLSVLFFLDLLFYCVAADCHSDPRTLPELFLFFGQLSNCWFFWEAGGCLLRLPFWWHNCPLFRSLFFFSYCLVLKVFSIPPNLVSLVLLLLCNELPYLIPSFKITRKLANSSFFKTRQSLKPLPQASLCNF